MIIKELYIKNFGKISEQHIYLRDGLQVICGENEFGKSTIHAFIRAMLFGLERGRGRAAAKDDFTRYEPWDNPGCYAGVMRFSCGERNFRLERNFARMSRSVSLVCEDDGEELSVEHGDLDMLLGGMTAELFDSTVSVGQLKAKPGEELPETLENYAADYLESGGNQTDVNQALQMLREKKKTAVRALREERERQEEKKKEFSRECIYLERDMKALREEYDEKKNQLDDMNIQSSKHEQDRIPEETGIAGKKQKRRNSLLTAGGAGILIGIIGMAWSKVTELLGVAASSRPFGFFGMLIGAAGVLLLICGIVCELRRTVSDRRTHSRDRKPDTDGNFRNRSQHQEAAEQNGGKEKAAAEREKLIWELGRIQSQFKEKEIRRGNLLEQSGEFVPGDVQISLERQCRALELAEKMMIRAAEETSGYMKGLVNQNASEIFEEITGGKYRSMSYDRKNGFRVWDGERQIPADRLSRGTLEQIWFSFRMAGAQALQEEPMPVILDETFAFYDEKRLQSVLKWLRGQKKQVIIFTCHNREELV